MFGLLNINKPRGPTSRDVVNHVQRLVRPTKVGHAGTLDPLATGVLIVCLGPATRLIPYVQQAPKRYKATFLLGKSSDTDDVEGQVIELAGAVRPHRQQIENVLPGFVGEIQQRPPAYAAVKVQGRRAYQLAREGHPPQLDARPVAIHGIRLLAYDYPELRLEISCGSGTYVRALGRDLAEAVGTSAVMSELVRTAIGDFCVEDACELGQLTGDSMGDHLLPPIRALGGMLATELTDDEVRRVIQGVAIQRSGHGYRGETAAADRAGRLVAILAPRGKHHLRPVRCFPVR